MGQTVRRPRLILFFIVFVLTAILLYNARGAIGPFVVGLVVAYLLSPLVDRIQKFMPEGAKRRKLARPLSILTVYLIGLSLLMAALFTIVPLIADQLGQLIDNAPELYTRARTIVLDWLDQYRDVVPPQIQERIEGNAETFDPMVVIDPLLGGTLSAVGAVRNFVSSLVGWLVIPFWMFFILNAESSFVRGALGLIPRDFRADAEAMRIIVDRVLSGYIRGQLLVALEIGILSTIGLMLLGVPYALLLGLLAGAFGIIPFLGAILGALPAVVVAFLQEPQLALWVVLVFVVVQQIDNIIFSPRIMGDAVALHPAIIMVVIVVGTSLLGVIGAVIAVPLTAILRDIVQYIYIRVGEPIMTPVEALARVGYGDSATPVMTQPSLVSNPATQPG